MCGTSRGAKCKDSSVKEDKEKERETEKERKEESCSRRSECRAENTRIQQRRKGAAESFERTELRVLHRSNNNGGTPRVSKTP